MRRIFRKWKEIWSGDTAPPREMERVFTQIYRSNAWGSEESVSGPGSTEQRGASFRDDLLAALHDLGTRTLLDVPCGDFNWIGPVADALDQYVGVDIVPEIIAANLQRHAGPGRKFLRLDLTRDPLPPADVILCRDGLVHFAVADIWRALENLRRTGARYLITTTFIGDRENEDIATGGWRGSMRTSGWGFGGWGTFRSRDRCVMPVAAFSAGVRLEGESGTNGQLISSRLDTREEESDGTSQRRRDAIAQWSDP